MATATPKLLGTYRRVLCVVPDLPEYLQTGTTDDAKDGKHATWYHVSWDDGTGGWHSSAALENLVEEET